MSFMLTRPKRHALILLLALGTPSFTFAQAETSPAQRSQLPQSIGIDPSAIPLSDTVITHTIPLKNIDAAALVKDLSPLLSRGAAPSADTTRNELTITDTSARVRRLVTILARMDSDPSALRSTTLARFSLRSASAKSAAATLNLRYRPTDTNPSGLGPPPVRLYVDYDAPTNTIVVVGSPDQVQSAIATTTLIDFLASLRALGPTIPTYSIITPPHP